MIKRIVKLSFEPEKINDFLDIFAESKEKIRQSVGCRHLELLRCKSPNHIFFTYSYWDNEKALDDYRHSDLFRATWAKTKQLFNDKPEAWSVQVVFDAMTNNLPERTNNK